MNKKVLIFGFLLLFVIFFRYQDFLFFTWDQGRDAFKLEQIVGGDLTLIGPTSGLQGFFLGPLWYYIGVPGFMLGNGNPYIISIWYSLLTFLAIPAIYLSIKQLFPKQKQLHWLFLFLIFFSPGFIKSTTMIWNPLLSVPLLSWAIYALLQKKNSNLWLFLGFSFLGLLLQSEFAYGVFIVSGLFLTLNLFRTKTSLKEYLLAILGIAWTMIPQLVFELKNNWLISRSLISNMLGNEGKVPFSYLFKYRPGQIISVLAEQLFGSGENFYKLMALFFILVIIYFVFKLIKNNKLNKDWTLIYLIFFLPLIGYSFWSGNHGNLFSYYVTPHFIPLYLILFQIFIYFPKIIFKKIDTSLNQIILIFLVFINLRFATNRIFQEKVNSGLTNSLEAIEYIYQIAALKSVEQPIIRIFVANRETEHYDYLTKWYATQNNLPIAKTTLTDADQDWYVLIEPDTEHPEERFVPWYEEVTKNGFSTQSKKNGILQIEEWQKL